MISKHVYSAFLVGTPDVELSVKGGTITLDAGQAPHVTASIDIDMSSAVNSGGLTPAVTLTPSATLTPSSGSVGSTVDLTALDPREGVRVRVDVDATFPTKTQSRSFNLGLRSRTVRHRDGVVTLDLASDEALLTDYAPFEDDTAPRSLEGSLRDIVDYVLNEVDPGAALESTPDDDADMTAYWPLTNLVTNPSGYPGTQGYSAGGNCSAVESRTAGYVGGTSVRWRSAGSGGCYLKAAPVSMDAGQTYYMSARIINTSGRNLRIGMWFYDPAGGLISTYESPVTVASGGYDLLETFITPPPGVASAVPFAIFGALGAAETAALDALMVVPSDEAVEYFQPGVSVPGYTMSWESGGGGEGYAQATRTPDVERDPESTIWRAGTSAMDFLAPLVQAAGLRLVCNESSEWTLRPASYTSPGQTVVRHAVNLLDADDTLTREPGTWFDGAVAEYKWTDRNGIQQRKIDSYGLVDPPTSVRFFERDTAFPGPGFAQYAVERAQGRGREVQVVSVANWDASAEQDCEISLLDSPVQTGKTESVTFRLDDDTMLVRARTVDTADLAWSLGPDDLAWDDVDGALTWDAMTDWSDA